MKTASHPSKHFAANTLHQQASHNCRKKYYKQHLNPYHFVSTNREINYTHSINVPKSAPQKTEQYGTFLGNSNVVPGTNAVLLKTKSGRRCPIGRMRKIKNTSLLLLSVFFSLQWETEKNVPKSAPHFWQQKGTFREIASKLVPVTDRASRNNLYDVLVNLPKSAYNNSVVVLVEVFAGDLAAQLHGLVEVAGLEAEGFAAVAPQQQAKAVLVEHVLAHVFAKAYKQLVVSGGVEFFAQGQFSPGHVAYAVQVGPGIGGVAGAAGVPAHPSLLEPYSLLQGYLTHAAADGELLVYAVLGVGFGDGGQCGFAIGVCEYPAIADVCGGLLVQLVVEAQAQEALLPGADPVGPAEVVFDMPAEFFAEAGGYGAVEPNDIVMAAEAVLRRGCQAAKDEEDKEELFFHGGKGRVM